MKDNNKILLVWLLILVYFMSLVALGSIIQIEYEQWQQQMQEK